MIKIHVVRNTPRIIENYACTVRIERSVQQERKSVLAIQHSSARAAASRRKYIEVGFYVELNQTLRPSLA